VDPTCQSKEDIATWAQVVDQIRKARKEEEKKKERWAEIRSAAQFIEPNHTNDHTRAARAFGPHNLSHTAAFPSRFNLDPTCGSHLSVTISD